MCLFKRFHGNTNILMIIFLFSHVICQETSTKYRNQLYHNYSYSNSSKYENILQAWTIFPEASGEGEMTMMLVAVAARKGRVTAKAKGKKLGHSLSGGQTGDGVQLSGNETAAQQI